MAEQVITVRGVTIGELEVWQTPDRKGIIIHMAPSKIELSKAMWEKLRMEIDYHFEWAKEEPKNEEKDVAKLEEPLRG